MAVARDAGGLDRHIVVYDGELAFRFKLTVASAHSCQ